MCSRTGRYMLTMMTCVPVGQRTQDSLAGFKESKKNQGN